MKAYSLKIFGRPAVRPAKGERLMENKSLRFYAIMALWVVLFVLLFISNRRVDLKTDINKSTSVSVSVEDTVSLSPSVVTTRAYSAGDDTYQTFFEILQNASCYQNSTRMSAPTPTTTKRIPSPCALQTMPARTCSSPSIQTGSAR